MTGEYISPNWHVIFVHYPLALLTAGIVIEIFSFLWKRSTLRTAGRWMILLGTLMALPTLTTGIYAFWDAARASSTNPDAPWSDLVKASRWGEAQWSFMRYHIWLTSTSTGLFLLAVLAWLGSSDEWRQKLRWPVLIALVVALGGVSAGAWFSGEAVYRYGVAVEPQQAATVAPAQTTTTQPAPSHETAEHQHGTEGTVLDRYLDPLQTHLLLVGLTLALAVTALGLTLRRWNIQPKAAPETFAVETPSGEPVPPSAAPLPLADEMTPLPGLEPAEPTPPSVAERTSPTMPAPAVYPARFWLLTSLLALLTAAAGLWYLEGDWRLPVITDLLKQATSPTGRQELSTEQNRMLIHFILAINIILLPLILALITRFSRRLKVITLIGVALLLIAVGFQVWYGVMLLYSLGEIRLW